MENVEDIYALTPIQEGLLHHSISEPGSGVYVDQISAVLSGELETALFQQAWKRVLTRHTSLRVCFLWDGLDEPLQVVRERVELPWTEEDWRDLDAESAGRRLASWLESDRRRGFDLAKAPLMRIMLARLDARRWRWVWTFHHLISDGWSMSLLLRDVFDSYRANPAASPDTPATEPFLYRDYVAWHAQQDLRAAQRYWTQQLSGLSTPTRLQTVAPARSAGETAIRQQRHAIDPSISDALTALARDQRVTLNTVIQAAWALLVSRYAHDDDPLFGVTLSGRPPELDGIESGVGLFINTLPLRARIDPDVTLIEWLRRLQAQQFEMREWAFAPLVSVQTWSGVAAGEPLFDSILVFENYPGSNDDGDTSDGGIRVLDLTVLEQSNYPLAVLVLPGDCLEIIMVYDPAHFGDVLISRIHGQLQHLLEAFVAAPERRLCDYPLLTATERQQITVDWNATAAPAPPDLPVHVLIHGIADQRPDRTAVVFEDRTISYAELDDTANRLARRLRAEGVGRDVLVGLFCDRSIEMVVGILAILKAGGAYVPLDPIYPAGQLRYMVEDADLSLLLTRRGLVDAIPATTATVIAIDNPAATDAHSPDGQPADGEALNHLAYVLYTSGSSGRPKGVEITHGNLVHSIHARGHLYRGDVGRFLLLSSFAFDSSVAGIFWTLCSGGTLVLSAPGLEQDMQRLTGLIAERGITHLLCLPSLYALILDSARHDQLATLDTVMVAGESCPTSLIVQHLELIPRTRLFNEYGPTEGTVWCSAHQVTREDLGAQVPIGRPIANTRIYLLDQHRQPVPAGVAGELYITGPGVARGYHGQPALTRDCFVSLAVDGCEPRRAYRSGDLACYRDDGSLLFLGRSDSQVKIRGYRVELGGIGDTMARDPRVAEAAAALRDHPTRGKIKSLIGYLVLHSDRDPASNSAAITADLLDLLRRELPDYMVPEQLIALPALPRRPNGKLDFAALPAVDRGSSDSGHTLRAPESAAECLLAEIWCELLGLDEVGIDDNFFELGGDSIVSIQVMSRARQAGLSVEPAQMAAHPSIAGLAGIAQPASDTALAESDEAEADSDDAPVTPIQAWFFEHHHGAPQHWNQASLFEVPADIDADALARALSHCVQHHDALRTRFKPGESGWCQYLPDPSQDTEPAMARPLLAMVDLSDLAENERQTAMQQAIAQAQSSLDPGAGPLLRALLFLRAPGQPGSLLIAIHHLVVDPVSWGILIDDLEQAYRQALVQSTIELSPPTTSYRRWARYQQSLAETPALRAQIDAWLALPPVAADDLPVDFDSREPPTEADAMTLRVSLEHETTNVLLTQAPDAYHTRVDELLIAALLLGYHGWTGQSGLRVGLEGHGRSNSYSGIDLSRTVGWCTSHYPVNLWLPDSVGSMDHGMAIKAVKEQLRAIPEDGIGYGILRYLSGDRRTARALSEQPSPQLLFNYLGRGARSESTLFRRISWLEDSSRALRSPRPYFLEINASIDGGQLVMDVIGNRTHHRLESVQSLAQQVIESLQTLIEHCRAPGAGAYTPSDFPDAELSQDELDRFLDGID